MVSAVACFPSLLVRKSGLSSLFDRLYATGIRALPVVTVVALFTGMILSLQVGIELARFSQESYLGAAVMISLVRDGAAFSCGICLAACVGSAIAAEIGTMKVNDEIDALLVMDIPPMRFLAAPRVLALVLMAPLLMFYSINQQKYVTLAEYIEAMGEDQNDIYYAAGESIERLRNLPIVKTIRLKGYDVLMIRETDDVQLDNVARSVIANNTADI